MQFVSHRNQKKWENPQGKHWLLLRICRQQRSKLPGLPAPLYAVSSITKIRDWARIVRRKNSRRGLGPVRLGQQHVREGAAIATVSRQGVAAQPVASFVRDCRI